MTALVADGAPPEKRHTEARSSGVRGDGRTQRPPCRTGADTESNGQATGLIDPTAEETIPDSMERLQVTVRPRRPAGRDGPDRRGEDVDTLFLGQIAHRPGVDRVGEILAVP